MRMAAGRQFVEASTPAQTANQRGRRRLLRAAVALAAAGAGTAHGYRTAALSVGFIADFEPFVMEQTGILVDLMREALRRMGRELHKLDFPRSRLNQDPLASFPGLHMFVGTPPVHQPIYHYAPIYAFDNVAASLTDRKLDIRRLEDLAGKSIVAFNQASFFLKVPFRTFHDRILRNSSSYLEVDRMESVVAMLLNRRAQVILLDRTFLRYYARKLGHPDLAGITVHELFPEKNIIYAVSRHRDLIVGVRRSLRDMEKNGWVASMLKTYL
ncbi:MAG: transporter substrate-binding domain-containing protein [Burkholderiales bacterium]|nr:transporter substrate-binding domain-containing protein [Burkholderiales bacterium]